MDIIEVKKTKTEIKDSLEKLNSVFEIREILIYLQMNINNPTQKVERKLH